MGKRVRILTVVGMALVAGAGIGASPAQATTSTGLAAASPSHAQVQPDRDRDWVAGYYRTRRACERAGWLGERFNRWEDYDCDRAYRGFRRGWWELSVERGWRGHGHGHGARQRARQRARARARARQQSRTRQRLAAMKERITKI